MFFFKIAFILLSLILIALFVLGATLFFSCFVFFMVLSLYGLVFFTFCYALYVLLRGFYG